MKSVLHLGVNIDHIATLREARRIHYPDPLEGALAVEGAGAYSVVVHLREDRRHIKDQDVLRVKKNLKRARLNLEMSCALDIVSFACKVLPYQSTLVPEKRKELTTEGGLDLFSNRKKIEKAICRLKSKGIKVSLFIDPCLKQIKRARS